MRDTQGAGGQGAGPRDGAYRLALGGPTRDRRRARFRDVVTMSRDTTATSAARAHANLTHADDRAGRTIAVRINVVSSSGRPGTGPARVSENPLATSTSAADNQANDDVQNAIE